jgi:hypothetical protein
VFFRHRKRVADLERRVAALESSPQVAHVEPGVTKVFIGERQVAEAVTRYSLTRAARH